LGGVGLGIGLLGEEGWEGVDGRELEGELGGESHCWRRVRGGGKARCRRRFADHQKPTTTSDQRKLPVADVSRLWLQQYNTHQNYEECCKYLLGCGKIITSVLL
jgi:hypothetical protein